MANVKKGTYGSLIIILATIATFYLALQGSDVSMKITTTSATFYVNESGTLVIAGVENVYLYNGTKKMTASLKEPLSSVKNGNIITLTKRTHYGNFTVVEETYDYDTTKTNVESFPISHKIKVIDGVGYTLQYEVSKLTYNGTSRDAKNPESFGHKMKVEWQDGASYQKISKTTTDTKLTIKYKVTAPSSSYNVRLFDPIVIDNVANFTVAQCQSINDANVFIEACPTTVTQSQWVYVNLTPKLFTGNIDFAIGVNGANAHMSQFQLYKNITIVNGSNTTSYMDFVNYNLQDVTYNYDSKDSWSVGQNVPVIATKSYIARFYLDIVPNTNGKYDIALKPSTETFAQAVANGHLYILDPWWNSTSEIINNNTASNNWLPISQSGITTARTQPIYPKEDNLLLSIGMENTASDELGRFTGVGTSVSYVSNCKIGGCYNFTAAPSYITITPRVGNELNKTFTGWFNPYQYDVGVNSNSIFSFDGSSASYGRWSISIDNTTSLGFTVNDGTYNKCFWSINGSWPLNTWTFFALIQNTTTTTLIINNQTLIDNALVSSVANCLGVGTNNQYIGAHRFDTGTVAYQQRFKGMIDEFKIYNTALTKEEVSIEYNNGLGRKYQEVRIQQQYPYNNNILSYYRGENDSLDETYKYSGTLTGGTYSSGKIGSGFNLSDNSQTVGDKYVQMPSALTWDSNTINMWIKKNTATNYPAATRECDIFGTQNAGNTIYLKMGFHSTWADRLYYVRYSSPTATAVGQTPAITDTNWHMITMVTDTTSVKMYIDGNLTNTTTGSATSISTGTQAKFGTLGGVNDCGFNGSIDEISVFNRTLNSSEILYLYNNGTGRIYDETKNMFYSTVANGQLRNLYPLQNNLMESWGFDTTNFTDLNRYNGALSGSASIASTGIIGSSYNGTSLTSGQISIPNDASLYPQNLSITVWVNVASVDSNNYASIIGNGCSDPGTGWELNINPTVAGARTFAFDAGAGSAYTGWGVASTTALNASQWYFLSVVKNGTGNVSLYLNGRYEASAVAGTIYSNAVPTLIGRRASNCLWIGSFNGQIDELKLYNRPITLSEIQAEYNNGSGRKYESSYAQNYYPIQDSLVEKWNFDNNTLGEKYSISPYIVGTLNYTTGVKGQSIQGFSSSNYVKVPITSVATAKPLTVNMWVKWNSSIAASVHHLYYIGGNPGTTNDPIFYILYDGTNKRWESGVWKWADAGMTCQYSDSPSVDTWHMATQTWNGANRRTLYIDGKLACSDASTPTSSVNSQFMEIGYNLGNNYAPFLGAIDEVSIYNKTLTDTEVAYLYDSARVRQYDDKTRLQNTYSYPSNLITQFSFENTPNDEIGKYAGTAVNVNYVYATNFSKVGSGINLTTTTSAISWTATNPKNMSASFWLRADQYMGVANSYSVYTRIGGYVGDPGTMSVGQKNSTDMVFCFYSTPLGQYSCVYSPLDLGNLNHYYMQMVQTGVMVNLSVWKNSVYIGSVNATITDGTVPSSTNYIGQYHTSLGTPKNYIDEFKLWENKQLTQAEINADYNNGSGRRFLIQSNISDYPYSKDLFAYYRMENNTIDEMYKTSGILNGTLTNDNIDCRIGNCYKFNGVSTNNIIGGTSLDNYASGYTVSSWVKYYPTTVPSATYPSPWNLGVDISGGGARVELDSASGNNFTCQDPSSGLGFNAGINLNEVRQGGHLVVVWDKSRCLTYWNGQLRANGSMSITENPWVSKPVIGWGYANLNARAWSGSVDELMIYSRVLTTAEIQNIYSLQSQGKYQDGYLSYPAFKMQLNASDKNASVKVSTNYLNYTNYYTSSDNNRAIKLPVIGYFFSNMINLTGTATYSPYVTGFGMEYANIAYYLSGKVTYSNSSNVNGATVYAINQGTLTIEGNATTNSSGSWTYTIPNWDRNQYILCGYLSSNYTYNPGCKSNITPIEVTT